MTKLIQPTAKEIEQLARSLSMSLEGDDTTWQNFTDTARSLLIGEEPSPPKPVTRLTRTAADLRDMLFDEMDSLRKGKSDYRQANGMAKLAREIVNTSKAEIEFAKMNKKAKDEGWATGLEEFVQPPTLHGSVEGKNHLQLSAPDVANHATEQSCVPIKKADASIK